MSMTLVMPLVAHVLMSLVMLALPHLTRREILFGVALPADFRTSPEGRQAIRVFRFAIAIPAILGIVAILLWGSRFVPVFLLAPAMMMLAGFATFVLQNRKLRAFAVQPKPVRELELSAEAERLPWFAWLGLAPLLLLAAVALYIRANWDRISGDRSSGDVYGPLIIGAAFALWLFGFALATWYGSRRSEPLRRPALGVFIMLGWVLALLMPGLATQALTGLPPVALVAPGMATIMGSFIYLVRKSRQEIGRAHV